MPIDFTTVEKILSTDNRLPYTIVQAEKQLAYYPPVFETMTEGWINQNVWDSLCLTVYCETAPEYVSIIENVYITPNGLIIASDGRVLREAMLPFDLHNCPPSVVEQLRLNDSGRVDLTNESYANAIKISTAIFGREIGESGYYHLITSLVPRILRARDAMGSDGSTLDILYEQWVPQMTEAASIFGFLDQVKSFNGQYLYVDRLIFPSPTQLNDSHYTRPAGIFSIYEKFVNNKKKATKSLFVSREDAASRRLINEAEIAKYIVNCKIIKNSDLSVSEQINAFNCARLVIGAHGAGLTNIIFMNPGGCVVELISENRIWPSYRVICERRNLRYIPIVGNTHDDSGNFQIDTKFVVRTVESIINDQIIRSNVLVCDC